MRSSRIEPWLGKSVTLNGYKVCSGILTLNPEPENPETKGYKYKLKCKDQTIYLNASAIGKIEPDKTRHEEHVIVGKEEEIQEMAKVMCRALAMYPCSNNNYNPCSKCEDFNASKQQCISDYRLSVASDLYNSGYRKVEKLKESLEAEVDNLSYVNNYNESVVKAKDIHTAIEKVLNRIK